MRAITLALLLVSATASAGQGTLQAGRYIDVKLDTAQSKSDLLGVPVQVVFPDTIRTVADAIDYLLIRSGYRADNPDKVNRVFSSLPLPAVQRRMGPMTLREALIAIAGPAWTLKENPLTRTVSYQPAPQYAQALASLTVPQNTPEKAEFASIESTQPITHVVRSGETLMGIAMRYAPRQPEAMASLIYHDNPHAFGPGGPDHLYAGEVLVIPEGVSP